MDNRQKIVIIMSLIIFPIFLIAQWSDDPTANTIVSSLEGDQAVPKLAVTENGDTFMGWMSNNNGNYDVRIQRYNVCGEMQWEQNGILVSNHPQDSWITDWDMQADNSGNAILAFNDIRSGNWDIYTYKISPSGEFLWGSNGIQISYGAGMDVAPRIIATSENNVIVAWSAADDGEIRIQKILEDGAIAWEDDYIISGNNSYTWPQLLPIENDAVLVKYFEDSGPVWAPDRYVYAKKLDADGLDVWNNDAVITDAGGISAWNQIFSIISDNTNGFYIAWHEDRDGDQNANIYYQHVYEDGSVQFEDGQEIVVDYNFEHYYPYLALDNATSNIYASWTKMDMDQNMRGISSQMLDSDGNRLWGDVGVSVLELGSNDPMVGFASILQDNLVSLFSNNSDIVAYRLGSDGNFVWDDAFTYLSTNSVNPFDLSAVQLFDYSVVAFWREDTGLYAQNVNIDGSLGEFENTLDAPENIQVDAESGLVTWDAPDENFPDSYNIYLDEQLIANVGNDVFQYLLEDLIYGEYYLAGVAARYGEELSDVITFGFTYEGVTADDALVLDFNLRNYPNPFNPTTTISFSTKENFTNAKINIYNSKGQKVKTLLNDQMPAGEHKIVWNGDDNLGNPVSTGLYYYRLSTDDNTEIKKMMLLK